MAEAGQDGFALLGLEVVEVVTEGWDPDWAVVVGQVVRLLPVVEPQTHPGKRLVRWLELTHSLPLAQERMEPRS